MSKNNLIHTYFSLWKKYTDKYGKGTVLFMEVGSFFESYGYGEYGNCDDIGELCRLIVTRKSKKKEASLSNPYMLGFPNTHLSKFLDILLRHNRTIVVYEQYPTDNTGKNFDRRLKRIYSPGTVIDESSDISPWILGILVEEYNSRLNCSLSLIDVSTGKSELHFYSDTQYDKQLSLDIIKKILSDKSPKEIILYNQTSKNLNELNLGLNNSYDKEFENPNYQNSIFQKILNKDITTLNLEQYPNLSLIFCLTLNFIYEHSTSILNSISSPIIILRSSSYLELLGDTTHQFDLSTLFNIINKTSTALGKRLLKERLFNPITDSSELKKRYQRIEDMKDWKLYEDKLRGIVDIERLQRKMSLSELQPTDFFVLFSSYKKIVNLLLLFVKKKRYIKNFKIFRDWMKELKNKISFSSLESVYLSTIDKNLFVNGIYSDLDFLEKKIEHSLNFFEENRKILCDILGDDVIKLSFNEIDGHYYSLTLKRANVLKGKLLNKPYPYELEIKNLKGTSKITFKELRKQSQLYRENINILRNLVKEKFKQFQIEEYNRRKNIMNWLVQTVAEIDVIKSSSKVADKYSYCKPVLSSASSSSLKIKQLRHPIVERIQTDIPFTPNDLILNKGQLIFGLNSGGKSTFLKSVGISIILAQMGMYVPATSFEYKPFYHIISKILHRDNILSGKSTFIVELEHMKAMLNRSNENSLILADELCSGTERPSAIGLVSSMVNELNSRKVPFIFTSHFHDLISTVKDIDFYHFNVTMKEGKIIFDRKLKQGTGESIYGIEIAQALDLDSKVVRNALGIRRKLLGENLGIVNKRKSKYNSQIYMDKCNICGKEREGTILHTHHILFQSMADDKGKIGSIHKNDKHNLAVLCEECHTACHDGKIRILGYEKVNDKIELIIEN